jgi:hypothetical protein
VFILKVVKVACFHTLLQVLILKVLAWDRNLTHASRENGKSGEAATQKQNASRDAGALGKRRDITHKL